MSQPSAYDALESYFHDLLSDTDEKSTIELEPAAKQSPARQQHSAEKTAQALSREHTRPAPASKRSEQTSPPESAPFLEDLQRQKLQALLSHRTHESLRVKVEAPKSLPEEKPLTPDPPKIEVEAATQATDKIPADLLAWGENGRPLWADESFEVLLFEVSGLSLAVPLVALGQIVPLDEKLTSLSGQSEWFMGILPSLAGDIRCVNTALFVMPERYQESFLTSAKYVVTIDGLAWGLAVDGVKQPIRLSPEDVKWRSQRSQRPWLAGTVKSHMCALIDIPQMGELLQRADRNAARKA